MRASVPRACIRSESIVTEGDVSFVSIGTNDLTQLMFGFSRDDTAKYLVRNEIHDITDIA
jgi:pyruvate,orthophosphate dikinase